MPQDIINDKSTGSGNDLVPLGKKSLNGSMLTQFYDAIWYYYDTITQYVNPLTLKKMCIIPYA